MNKKWICLVLAALLVAVSMVAMAEQTPSEPTTTEPSTNIGDVTPKPTATPTKAPSGNSGSGSSSSNRGSSVSTPVATPIPAIEGAAIAAAANVTVTSSNENVTVTVPTTLPSAVMAQAANAIAVATSVRSVISSEVAATAQMLLGTAASLDDMKPKANVELVITVSGNDDATIRIDLSREIAASNVKVGANILGLVTMIKGGVVSYDVAASTYQGAGQVDVNFTADQLTAMADADEVMYTLLTD